LIIVDSVVNILQTMHRSTQEITIKVYCVCRLLLFLH